VQFTFVDVSKWCWKSATFTDVEIISVYFPLGLTVETTAKFFSNACMHKHPRCKSDSSNAL